MTPRTVTLFSFNDGLPPRAVRRVTREPRRLRRWRHNSLQRIKLPRKFQVQEVVIRLIGRFITMSLRIRSRGCHGNSINGQLWLIPRRPRLLPLLWGRGFPLQNPIEATVGHRRVLVLKFLRRKSPITAFKHCFIMKTVIRLQSKSRNLRANAPRVV